MLDKTEINRLIFEGIITISAMSLIYFGCLFIFQKIIYQNTNNIAFAWRLVGINETVIYWLKQFFTLFVIALTIWFTQWRLARRYRQIELNHMLLELNYIASGHYEHRISPELAGRMSDVAQSINRLVDSTVMAREEERRIEQTKQELITNVSHDIRTPLTSIIGYLTLIKDEQYESTDEMKQFVGIAYQKAQQMEVLADRLFEYATMQYQEELLQKKYISISNFLSQIAAEYHKEAKEHQMTLSVCVEEVNLFCYMDPEKMVRVYDNLLTNAFKYSQASDVVLSAKRKKDTIVLGVSNNGVMIDEEDQKQLFIRFYRQDKARTQTMQGSGLGLAIVESVILAHHGKIWVTSTPQETSFHMALPIQTRKDSNQ